MIEPTPRQPAPETASAQSIENAYAAFPPLPLRPRGTLELLDVSIKVYKQYLAVLFGWSVLVVTGSVLAGIVGMVVPFGGSVSSVLLSPVMTGVVACCLAAGVRGQRVDFGQCWKFTKPRFWPMVGLYILAFIITMLAFLAFMLVCGLIGGAGFLIFQRVPEAAQIVLALIGGLLLLTAGTIFGTVATAWANLVPVVVCMEPDKMNSQALGRAYELIRGQWVRVCTLTTMLGLGIAVLYGILWGVAALLIGLGQIKGMLNGQNIDNGTWAMIVGFFLLNIGLYVIYRPIFSIIINLFYLDMRVRNEALDLEWNAHVTAPPQGTLSTSTVAPTVQLPTGFANANPTSPAAPYADPYAMTSPGYNSSIGYDATSASPTYDFASNAAAPTASFETPLTPGQADGATPPGTTEPTALSGAPSNQVAWGDAAPAATTIKCPKCGVLSPAAYIYCMKCGTQLRNRESGPQW